MAKKLNYQVGFTADTSSLQQALNQALNSLQRVGTQPNLQLTKQLKEASNAALDLSNHLRNAFNQETGKLDLVSFNNSLKRSNTSLGQYADKLISIGPAGEQAFLNVAQAIAKAELPLRRSNKLLNDLWITMKNTMRWQLTSSALHGFIGSIQAAYGYTKDLNESLNNIQIVTNKNVESMHEFAEEANKAAKALSTTTTDYTNASLIYYQQGLSDEEVLGRTETTIKLANVAGETAETASEQLTAIWNNFYDGSKSLEYYADVMTALGASTASSTQEISAGLQKFAAIADTVGLSYEYASSALATITATTRESADVVGTALRTLFARIQGLQQDQTQDDGTTLNKYSKALAEVGISIKDTEGELKGMNAILDEMGAKWQTLTQAQKMALAQTVAGVRQYSQLIALMENYDFFQENLTTAMESEGTLNKQAEIYAKSWEAARDRTRAAAEDIYDSLINPDFYIGVDNVITPFLTGVAKVIDTLGGMQGVLAVLGTLMNKVYGDRIAQSLRDMATNLGIISGKESERARNLQASASLIVDNLSKAYAANDAEQIKLDILKQEIQIQGAINSQYDTLNSYQKQIIADEQYKLSLIQQQRETTANRIAELSSATATGQESMFLQIGLDGWQDRLRDEIRNWNSTHSKGYQINLTVRANSNLDRVYNDIITKLDSLTQKRAGLKLVNDEFLKLDSSSQTYAQSLRELIATYDSNMNTANMTTQQLENVLKGLGTQALNTGTEIRELGNLLKMMGADTKVVDTYVAQLIQLAEKTRLSAEEQSQYNKVKQDFLDLLNRGIPTGRDWASTVVSIGTALSQATIAIRAIQSLGRVFNDEDMTISQRLLTLLTSLSMILPVIVTAMKALNLTTQITIAREGEQLVVRTAGIGATLAKAAADKVLAAGEGEVAAKAAAANAALLPQIAVLAAIVVAVTAAIAIISHLVQSQEKQIAQAKEAHEAVQQEIQDNYDLISSYQELLSTYEETGDGKEELSKKAIEMAEALGLEGAAVANLTGDYSGLNAQVEETLKTLNKQSLLDNIVSKTAYEDSFVKSMRKGTGHISFNGYSANLGGYLEDTDAQSQVLLASDFYRDYGLPHSSTIAGGFEFNTRNTSAQELVKMYEEAKEALKDMSDAQVESGETSNEVYENLRNWIQKSEESYREYKAIVDEIEDQSFKDAVYSVDKGQIDSFEDYLNYYNRLNEEIQKRVDNGQIEADNVETLTKTYLAGEEELRKYAIQQQLINDLTNKFNVDISKDNDTIKLFDKLSEETLQTMITIVPQVSNAEEFQNQVERILIEAVGDAAQNSMNVMGALVQELNSESHITDDNYETLMADSGFMENVTTQFESFDNWRKLSEQQQIEYIRDYYTAVSSLAVDNLEEQRKNAQESFNIASKKYQALMELSTSEEQSERELFENIAALREEYANASDDKKDELLNQWDNVIDKVHEVTGIDIDFDISDADETIDVLGNELDKLAEKIDSIKQKEIEIAINWDDFDDIKGQIDSLQDFASIMQDSAAKIGSSYQYPIDKIRDWMNVYPELFAKAQVNTNGLIQLNQDEVNAFITGKKEETNANAESKIEQWQLEKQNLEIIKEDLLAEAQAYQSKEQGKIDITELSFEQIAKLAQQLTEYQIQNGIDEATAHKNVLTAMGLNEEEYSRIVAKVSETNANNVIGSTAEGAEKGATILSQFSISWKNLAHNVGEVAKKIGAALQGEEYEVNFKDVFSFSKSTSSFKAAETSTDFKGTDVDPNVLIEQFKADRLKQLDIDLSQIDNAIANIDAKILAAKAMMNAPATQGSGDIKTDKGSKKEGNKEGKTYDSEDLKTLEDIEDRYHEITREIERQSDLLDDIGNEIDRVYGSDKIQAYKKELQALEKQVVNYQEKLREATDKYLPRDTGKLQELFDNNVTIKENGEISNYEGLLQQTLNDHNAFLIAYNQFLDEYSALSKDEQEIHQVDYDYWQVQKEASEAAYNARLEALKQYEDTRDKIQELKDNIEDTNRQIADNKLTQVEYRLELVIDVKSMKDALRDFDKEVQEIFNDALTHGIPVANITRDQAQADAAMLPEYQKQFDDLKALYESADNDMDRQRIIEDIKQLQSDILDSASAIVEWVNSIEDIIPEAVDAARERYELFTKQLEHNTTVLDTIKELYTLQGVTYKTMDGFNRLQNVSQERLDAQLAEAQLQRAWYDEARLRLQQAQADLDSLGGNETDLRYDAYKKARDAYLDEFNEAQEAYLSLAKDAMQTAQDMYLEQIEQAVYEFGQVVSNGVGLDLLQEKYDHYIEKDERYFDKVNEAYQVTAWFNKLQQDIDKTTNSATKERLQALQDEINIRREGNKLSQYDLDILNAKYEVLQAQMALEDAQNIKNRVQLVRDSQGNWNYQYTADAEQVANAEQDLVDAQNEWYNIAKQQVTDVTGEIVSTWQECQEKIKEIYSDMTLTDQERSDRAAEIYQYYTDKIKYLEKEKQVAISDMTEAGNASLLTDAILMGDELTDLTGLTAEEVKDLVEQNGGSVIDLLTANNETIKNIVASNTDLIDLFDNVYGQDLDNMTSNTDKFESALQSTMVKAESDFNNYKETVSQVADETGTNLEELDTDTQELSDSTDQLRDSGLDAADALWDMVDAAADAAEGYLDLADSIWEAVEALRALANENTNYVESQTKEEPEQKPEILMGAPPVRQEITLPTPTIQTPEPVPTNENKLEQMSAQDKKGVAYAIWNGTAGWGTGATRKQNIEDKFGPGSYETYQGIVNDYDVQKKAKNGQWTNDIGIYSYDELRKKYGIQAFATGGYTGEFNNEKLAFLDEKELILNQQDTENILKAVDMVRTIASIEKMLDGNGIAAIALMAQRLGGTSVSTVSDSIEQTIHIDHVEFPNATSSDEIKEAFRSIADDAVQWARRRKE